MWNVKTLQVVGVGGVRPHPCQRMMEAMTQTDNTVGVQDQLPDSGITVYPQKRREYEFPHTGQILGVVATGLFMLLLVKQIIVRLGCPS